MDRDQISAQFHGPTSGAAFGANATANVYNKFLSPVAPAPRPKPFTAPPLPLHSLIGRDVVLEWIKEKLGVSAPATSNGNGKQFPSQGIAIHGLPGSGKTALALQLAYDKQVRDHFSDGILWGAIGPDKDVDTRLHEWGVALGIKPKMLSQAADEKEKLNLIRDVIGNDARILLIVDDVFSRQAADRLLAVRGDSCRFIVTTRLPGMAYDFLAASLDGLDPSTDGLSLLDLYAPGLSTLLDKTDRDLAIDILHRVGGLPLAITLMARYLQPAVMNKDRGRLKSALNDLCQIGGGGTRVGGPADAAIEKLWSVIKVSVDALSEKARQAVKLLSVFPPKPHTFSNEAAMHVSGILVESLDELQLSGLLEPAGDGRATMHQTIALYAARLLSEAETQRATARMIQFYTRYLAVPDRSIAEMSAEHPNVLASLRRADQHNLQAEFVELLRLFFDELEVSGSYFLADVRQYVEKAEAFASRLGKHDEHAAALQNLARVAEKLGNYSDAKTLLVQALQVCKKCAGPQADLQSGVYHLLGVVQYALAAYDDAEAHLKQGLEAADQLDPPNLRRQSKLLQRLAEVAIARGNCTSARDWVERCRRVTERIKPRDPERDTGLLLCEASLQFICGDYGGARNCLIEAIGPAETINHAERQIAIRHLLAAAEHNSEDASYWRSKEWLQRAKERALQIGHPWYLTAIECEFGELYLKQGAVPLAEDAFNTSLDLCPATGQDRRGFALFGLARAALYRHDTTAAYSLGRDSLAAFSGIRHGAAVWVRRWLVALIMDLAEDAYRNRHDDIAEAQRLFQEASDEAAQSTDHSIDQQAFAKYGLARCAAAAGHVAAATAIGNEAHDLFVSINHPKAAAVRDWLGPQLVVADGPNANGDSTQSSTSLRRGKSEPSKPAKPISRGRPSQ